jgi:pyridoxine 4-dehydrogenase
MTTTGTSTLPGGVWPLGDRSVTRFGFGAMQLAGPGVMGAPADDEGALAVLRSAVEVGITHIDTSHAYGPHVTNRLIRRALHPYPESLLIATKVGATRDTAGGWPTARNPEELHRQVRENMDSLGMESLDLVNLRMGDATGPRAGSVTEAFETLAALQQQGRIRHLGGAPDRAGRVRAEHVQPRSPR